MGCHCLLHELQQESAQFVWKGPERKCFRLHGQPLLHCTPAIMRENSTDITGSRHVATLPWNVIHKSRRQAGLGSQAVVCRPLSYTHRKKGYFLCLSIHSSTVSFIQEHTEDECQVPARHADGTQSLPPVHVMSLCGKSQALEPGKPGLEPCFCLCLNLRKFLFTLSEP